MASVAVVSIAAAAASHLPAEARSPETDARAGISAFTDNCFSPFLTAAKAREAFGFANIRHDFYDLDPFTSAAPSLPSGRTATPGTDRRCEVAFEGDYAAEAVSAVAARLMQEGLTEDAAVPPGHAGLRTDGTALLSARRLNPQKIAVVHVGTRTREYGTETFLNVERLRTPAQQ